MFILQEETTNSFIEWFIDENNRGIAGAEDTATSWVITGIVIAVLITAAMLFVKWLMKERATIKDKPWSKSKIVIFTLVGLMPMFAVLLAVYYFNLNFTMIIGIGGFFKGIVLAWIFYIALMVIGDLLTPWSRHDYALKKRRA